MENWTFFQRHMVRNYEDTYQRTDCQEKDNEFCWLCEIYAFGKNDTKVADIWQQYHLSMILGATTTAATTTTTTKRTIFQSVDPMAP